MDAAEIARRVDALASLLEQAGWSCTKHHESRSVEVDIPGDVLLACLTDPRAMPIDSAGRVVDLGALRDVTAWNSTVVVHEQLTGTLAAPKLVLQVDYDDGFTALLDDLAARERSVG